MKNSRRKALIWITCSLMLLTIIAGGLWRPVRSAPVTWHVHEHGDATDSEILHHTTGWHSDAHPLDEIHLHGHAHQASTVRKGACSTPPHGDIFRGSTSEIRRNLKRCSENSIPPGCIVLAGPERAWQYGAPLPAAPGFSAPRGSPSSRAPPSRS